MKMLKIKLTFEKRSREMVFIFFFLLELCSRKSYDGLKKKEKKKKVCSCIYSIVSQVHFSERNYALAIFNNSLEYLWLFGFLTTVFATPKESH